MDEGVRHSADRPAAEIRRGPQANRTILDYGQSLDARQTAHGARVGVLPRDPWGVRRSSHGGDMEHAQRPSRLSDAQSGAHS